MTMTELQKALSLSESSIRRDLSDLGIQPVGKRQRPQRYPDDSAERIREHRGLTPAAATGLIIKAEGSDALVRQALKSLATLKHAKRKARAGK